MKAILVIDMPDSCDKCELGYYSDGRILLCEYEDKVGNKESKPDWCPLKELPEKHNSIRTWDEYYNGYDIGWNDCIDNILKDKIINED